jgi:hypothetical protein
MNDESTVYGYIKNNNAETEQQSYLQFSTNRQMLKALPLLDNCALITQELFSIPRSVSDAVGGSSQLVHFGRVYNGVEYEWGLWIAEFEQLLQKMYWSSVVVHLETELSGTHTFTWDSGDKSHYPNDASLNIRCEWQHELGIVPRCG